MNLHDHFLCLNGKLNMKIAGYMKTLCIEKINFNYHT